MLVAVMMIVSGYLEYQLLIDFQNGAYTSQALATADAQFSDDRQAGLAIIYLVVYIISGFLILRWIHRANYNARQLGAENMKFTAGWSIGYYFIPILTLWKPYQAMKEIWKASKDSSDWASQNTSSIVPTWWAIWLISNILAQVIDRLGISNELSELINLNLITQFSNFLSILLSLVFLAIVNNIYKMQSNQLAVANKHINHSISPTETS